MSLSVAPYAPASGCTSPPVWKSTDERPLFISTPSQVLDNARASAEAAAALAAQSASVATAAVVAELALAASKAAVARAAAACASIREAVADSALAAATDALATCGAATASAHASCAALAAPAPPLAPAAPPRPPLPPAARVNAKGETIVRLRRPPPPPPPPPLPPLPPKRSVRKPQHLRTPVEKTPVKKFMPKDALKALLELPNYKALFDGRAFDPKSKTDAELVLAEYRRTQPSRQRGKGQEPILLNDEYWKLSLQQNEPYFQLKLERSKTAAPKGWDDETRPAAPMPRAAPTTVAQFTATLYEILGEDKSEVHCHWSDDGERVVFLDSDAFARSVCPRYFRHSKWTSFSRMLNMYEFRKARDGVCCLRGDGVFGRPLRVPKNT